VNALIRKPIISVLGHVDHGKTLFLDSVRGSTVTDREAGKITQHIGATEVPLEIVSRLSGELLKKFGFSLTIPGLLFIDTPGHEAFTNLRKRGGSIADLAVLIIDITQGIQPQTEEAIEILKSYKTPFIVGANKIDRLKEWNSNEGSFLENLSRQSPEAIQELDKKIYSLVGELFKKGFTSERFDNCTDFTKQLPIVPLSAKEGEGIPEVLMLLSGLSQKFLSGKLEISENEKAKGTILEVREERGLGITVDVILYRGILREGEEILLGGKNGVIKTKVRALFQPKPLEEMRESRQRFEKAAAVYAACGVKIAAPMLEEALPGAPLRAVLSEAEDREEIEKEIEETKRHGHTGVVVRADTLGSIEAIAKMLEARKVNIKKTDVGDVSKKDVAEAAAVKEKNPTEAAIISFGSNIDSVAKEEAKRKGIRIFSGNVIYALMEEFGEWQDEKREELKKAKLARLVMPVKFTVLKGLVFRRSGPAVVGVKIGEGRLRKGVTAMKESGRLIGEIASIQSKNKEVETAEKGSEVAVSIKKGVVGRNIKEGDTLYSYVPGEQFFEIINSMELDDNEKELLEEIKKIGESSKEVSE